MSLKLAHLAKCADFDQALHREKVTVEPTVLEDGEDHVISFGNAAKFLGLLYNDTYRFDHYHVTFRLHCLLGLFKVYCRRGGDDHECTSVFSSSTIEGTILGAGIST